LETGIAVPPCAISVPNLMTDRGPWVAGIDWTLNVRRLMYQSLIWAAVAGDDARRLAAPLDAEDLERLAYALIHRVRRNAELGGDVLGREMLIDQSQAIELAFGQSGNPGFQRVHARSGLMVVPGKTRVTIGFINAAQHKHRHAPSFESGTKVKSKSWLGPENQWFP
jgi:hypothetical protein